MLTLADPLSPDLGGATLPGAARRGAGQGVTGPDFAPQSGAGEGLPVTLEDVTRMDFTVRDTRGDGIRSRGADRITFRFPPAERSGEPCGTNRARGVCPVQSSDVPVDTITVRGACDAGIHIGHASGTIVRNPVAGFNVAGIGSENSARAARRRRRAGPRGQRSRLRPGCRGAGVGDRAAGFRRKGAGGCAGYSTHLVLLAAGLS